MHSLITYSLKVHPGGVEAKHEGLEHRAGGDSLIVLTVEPAPNDKAGNMIQLHAFDGRASKGAGEVPGHPLAGDVLGALVGGIAIVGQTFEPGDGRREWCMKVLAEYTARCDLAARVDDMTAPASAEKGTVH